MIVGPTSYFGVEPINQIGGGHAQRSFDVAADTIQKGLDILFGMLDEQFPMGILAHVLSEKIKAFLHVRDNCLRRRNAPLSRIRVLRLPEIRSIFRVMVSGPRHTLTNATTGPFTIPCTHAT